MIGYIKAGFDPITEEAIQVIRRMQKENHYQEVILIPGQEGVASRADRYEMLKLATKRYRHIHVQEEDFPQAMDCSKLFASKEAKVREGNFNLSAHGIRQYLITHDVYLEEIVDAQCNAHRAMHSRSVAQVCKEIAKCHHLDEKKAWRMGMLHDITKKWDDEAGRKMLRIYDPDKLQSSPKIWHSYTAPIWIRQTLGITDAKLLSAIYHHTLGDHDADLDMILYIADKADPSRGYDSSYQINLAKKDLKKGFLYVKEESRKYLLEKEGIHV